MKRYWSFNFKMVRDSIFIFAIVNMMILCIGIMNAESQIFTEKQILSPVNYELFKQVKSRLYLGPAKKTATVYGVWSIVMAAYYGWVSPNVYIWNGTEYIIRSAFNAEGNEDIPPWSGFWIQANEDVNILIAPEEIPPPDPGTMELSLIPGKYYLISLPLIPASGDVVENFGSVLGPDDYEQTWRFSKWNYSSEQYERYTGLNSIPELIPGRGFWCYHNKQENQVLTLDGSAFPALTISKFQTPANQNSSAYHMIGNPYHYAIKWWNVHVEKPMDTSLELGKIADGSIFETMETWYIGLEVKNPDGMYQDTYNRAGVIEVGEDWHQLLCAKDFPPMGDYVRVTLRDPEASENIPMAYDYRPPGLDEYVWEVDLTTSLQDIDVRLNLNNTASVPFYYDVTFMDPESGNTFTINDDTSFDLSLSQNGPKTFLLVASREKPAYTDETIAPAAVKINAVSPNPFNPETTISFDTNRSGVVSVKVFNSNGQLTESLIDSLMPAGSHTVIWNAAKYSSGVYLISVNSGGLTDTRKVTFMK